MEKKNEYLTLPILSQGTHTHSSTLARALTRTLYHARVRTHTLYHPRARAHAATHSLQRKEETQVGDAAAGRASSRLAVRGPGLAPVVGRPPPSWGGPGRDVRHSSLAREKSMLHAQMRVSEENGPSFSLRPARSRWRGREEAKPRREGE